MKTQLILASAAFLSTAYVTQAQDPLCNPCVDPPVEELRQSFPLSPDQSSAPRPLEFRRMNATEFADLVSQSDRKLRSQKLPRGIVLLPGYAHEPGLGSNTRTGTIFSNGRLTIRYEIGPWAGKKILDRANESLWTQSLRQDRRLLQVALLLDRTLMVSFENQTPNVAENENETSYANFWAAVETENDIAQVLMMLMGYDE